MAAGKSQAGGGPGAVGELSGVSLPEARRRRRAEAASEGLSASVPQRLSLSDCPTRKEGPSVSVPQRRSLKESP